MTPVAGVTDVDGPMNGMVSLVTGATSGIGKAAAEMLAQLGATVARREKMASKITSRTFGVLSDQAANSPAVASGSVATAS